MSVPGETEVLTPAALSVDADGVLANATGRYEKRMRDLAGVFHDEEAFAAALERDPDELVYEVYEHRTEERAGELIFGTSILLPGRIGREFHMTRGHLHDLADRSEIYTCLRGHGLMHMETLAGETSTLELVPGTTAYVPGHWIHRSVNVGDEPLITLFAYSADAGQDYDVIARAGGMRELVVEDGKGGWTAEANPRYTGRG
jgi:glucose-6-phosphate isomerase